MGNTDNPPNFTMSENVIDTCSQNLPITAFTKEMQISVPKSGIAKDKDPNDEGLRSETKVICIYCKKVCKSSRGFLLHKENCAAYQEVYCRICTALFEKKEQLDKHVQDVHPNGGGPTCPICSQTFKSFVRRDFHMRQTHNNGQYPCMVCDKQFKSKPYLSAHMSRNHSGDSECRICHEIYPNATKLRYHLTHTHNEYMKYKCSYCNKPFASQFSMRVHQRSHTGERPFLCSECGVSFRYKNKFVEHMKTHDVQINVKCDVCGLVFSTERQLSYHKRKHMSKNHTCEVCSESFTYKLDLYTHRYNEHRLSKITPKRKVDYPFECPQCNKGFSVHQSLIKHLKIHTDSERKHICLHCGNGYKRSDHLKLHIKRMHLKVFEHKCEVCGKEYLEKGQLKVHMIVHNSDRPFTCTKCPISFKRKRALNNHMLKHEGKKEYACEICGMRFFNPTVVVLHNKRVHLNSQKEFMSELIRTELEDAHLEIEEERESLEVLS